MLQKEHKSTKSSPTNYSWFYSYIFVLPIVGTFIILFQVWSGKLEITKVKGPRMKKVKFHTCIVKSPNIQRGVSVINIRQGLTAKNRHPFFAIQKPSNNNVDNLSQRIRLHLLLMSSSLHWRVSDKPFSRFLRVFLFLLDMALDPTSCLMIDDDILNFSLDGEDEDLDDKHNTTKPPSSSMDFSKTNSQEPDDCCGSFPVSLLSFTFHSTETQSYFALNRTNTGTPVPFPTKIVRPRLVNELNRSIRVVNPRVERP